jgi:hypothetical protein
MIPSPYRTPESHRPQEPEPDSTPALVVLALVAAVGIAILSHDKPAPSESMLVGAPLNITSHMGIRRQAR